MRIFHCSDTHSLHDQLIIPDGIDIFIHSGDAENSRDQLESLRELNRFLVWLEKLDIKHRLCVSGNHSCWVEKNEKEARLRYKDAGAKLLIGESIEVEGIKFWGSPLTPTFGIDWAYNRDRGKIGKVWEKIPDDTQILITHGPPKGILDLSENRKHEVEQCGDSALMSRINFLDSLIFNAMGHLHDFGKTYQNQGVLIRNGITYSNASCVTDGKFSLGLSSHGNLFEWNDGKIIPII